MSVEALVESIEAAAAEEAARLLADADAAVEARLATAEATARARVDAALAAVEPAILGAEARAINEARLRLVALRTARLGAATEAAFDLAARRLEAIGAGDEPGRWAPAVRAIVAETAGLVGSGEIRVRPADVALVADLFLAPDRGGIALVPDPAMPPGARARSDDGRVTIDATLPERMRRARATLLPAVAARLHETGTGSRAPVGAAT